MYYEGGEVRVDCVASNGCEIVRFGQIAARGAGNGEDAESEENENEEGEDQEESQNQRGRRR